jgi:hypothetical protein
VFVLSVLAGAFIALGAAFATTVGSGMADTPYGITRLLVGFAFTLGLTTLIDVVVVFLFTKPLMTLLARTKFFGGGHKFSGLDPEHLGVPALPGTRSRRPAVRRPAAVSQEGV